MQVSPLVALPHARSNAVRRLGLSVAIFNEGISYADGSESNCRLLFLIAIPAFAPTAHMPLLQHLAAFAHDAGRVQKLLEASTPGRQIKSPGFPVAGRCRLHTPNPQTKSSPRKDLWGCFRAPALLPRIVGFVPRRVQDKK